MAIFSTSDAKVLLPRNLASGLISTARTTSTVAKLSGREPQLFGSTEYLILNDVPKAEFVEENAQKSSTTGNFTSVTAAPHKAQVTMRFSEEVQWLDEDYQLHILSTLANEGAVSLSRALDFGIYHRINPLTGTEITAWTNYVGATENRVEMATGTDVDANFRAAVGTLVNAGTPVQVNGAAFDPKFSWALSSLMMRDGAGLTSQQRYPQLGFGTDVTSFMGIPVAQGNTVSGVPEAADTKMRAILGDFRNGIRWGVQRDLPVEIIRYGDPDGQGDLKRNNNIALRLEMVWGWYVFTDRFVVIEDAVAG